MTQYTILIVEDETDIRQNLAFSLGRDGFKVVEAEDGEIALKLAKEKKPDLILMDLMAWKKTSLMQTTIIICRI